MSDELFPVTENTYFKIFYFYYIHINNAEWLLYYIILYYIYRNQH